LEKLGLNHPEEGGTAHRNMALLYDTKEITMFLALSTVDEPTGAYA
jgi:hypothetical protein